MIGPTLGPTPGQLVAFRAYVETGSQKAAAHQCGIRVQTVKNHMLNLYRRLGVGGAMEAAMALGWITLPGDAQAGRRKGRKPQRSMRRPKVIVAGKGAMP